MSFKRSVSSLQRRPTPFVHTSGPPAEAVLATAQSQHFPITTRTTRARDRGQECPGQRCMAAESHAFDLTDALEAVRR
jgi:hypothetical protein